jgi:hypothetical protein
MCEVHLIEQELELFSDHFEIKSKIICGTTIDETTETTTDPYFVTCKNCLNLIPPYLRPEATPTRRTAPIKPRKKALCPFCNKERALRALRNPGKFQKHRLKNKICPGSRLTPEEAQKEFAKLHKKELEQEIQQLRKRIRELQKQMGRRLLEKKGK